MEIKQPKRVIKLRKMGAKRKIENPGKKFDPFDSCKLVNTLYCGECFGEVALSNQCPRTASIKVTQNTHFATLSH